MTLVTGPTGSGKTTTLYSALRDILTPELKFVSVEDPVEYQIDGVSQIQVKPSIDLTFAKALRSILRQDPDVLMIGEIRDKETATIAIEAALTGHQVLSTLHTNNAPATITRLMEMGVPEYLIASTLSSISAQRLVRNLCPTCAEPYQPSAALLARLPGARRACRRTIPPPEGLQRLPRHRLSRSRQHCRDHDDLRRHARTDPAPRAGEGHSQRSDRRRHDPAAGRRPAPRRRRSDVC